MGCPEDILIVREGGCVKGSDIFTKDVGTSVLVNRKLEDGHGADVSV